MDELEVGDVVKFDDKNQEMTVAQEASKLVKCQWFDKQFKLHTGFYDEAMLKIVKKKEN